jgi:hypothetical protein
MSKENLRVSLYCDITISELQKMCFCLHIHITAYILHTAFDMVHFSDIILILYIESDNFVSLKQPSHKVH